MSGFKVFDQPVNPRVLSLCIFGGACASHKPSESGDGIVGVTAVAFFTLGIVATYYPAMSLLQIVLDQINLVQFNVQTLRGFVDESLPVQAYSDEPIEMHKVLLGETSKVVPSSETGLVPVQSREVLL